MLILSLSSIVHHYQRKKLAKEREMRDEADALAKKNHEQLYARGFT